MAEGSQPSASGTIHNRGKKRSKSYYMRAKEGKRVRKDTMLSVGMRGFLLTCNHGIKPCIKEAYNLLSEYADQLYGPEKDPEEDEQLSSASEDEDECDDMEVSLKKEIAGMKKQRKDKQQRFQAVESGAKNVAFIKSKIDDPSQLVHRILTDIQLTKTSKSRHIMRMLPVTATFRSYLEDIEKNAGQVLKPHFECDNGQELSFRIEFKVRNCGHLRRDEVIPSLHRIVTEMGKHRVDLTNPDRVILVEGVRNVCCISVLQDFYKLKKYNLHAIMEDFTDGSKEPEKWKRKKKPPVATSDSASGMTLNESGDKIDNTEEKVFASSKDDPMDSSNENKECSEAETKPQGKQDATDVTSEGCEKLMKTDEEKPSESKVSGDESENTQPNAVNVQAASIDCTARDGDRQDIGQQEAMDKVIVSSTCDIGGKANETITGAVVGQNGQEGSGEVSVQDEDEGKVE